MYRQNMQLSVKLIKSKRILHVVIKKKINRYGNVEYCQEKERDSYIFAAVCYSLAVFFF